MGKFVYLPIPPVSNPLHCLGFGIDLLWTLLGLDGAFKLMIPCLQMLQSGALLVVVLIHRLKGTPIDEHGLSSRIGDAGEGIVHARIDPDVSAVVRQVGLLPVLWLHYGYRHLVSIDQWLESDAVDLLDARSQLQLEVKGMDDQDAVFVNSGILIGHVESMTPVAQVFWQSWPPSEGLRRDLIRLKCIAPALPGVAKGTQSLLGRLHRGHLSIEHRFPLVALFLEDPVQIFIEKNTLVLEKGLPKNVQTRIVELSGSLGRAVKQRSGRDNVFAGQLLIYLAVSGNLLILGFLPFWHLSSPSFLAFALPAALRYRCARLCDGNTSSLKSSAED